MKIKSFEDILVWQKAKEQTIYVYKLFSDIKDYSFKDQIQRASVSIMNNIAEGFDRKSSKDFARFLYMAKGSSSEVKSMTYLAKELDYINKKEFDRLIEYSEEVSKMLYGFISNLTRD